jgi:hypothetical protein
MDKSSLAFCQRVSDELSVANAHLPDDLNAVDCDEIEANENHDVYRYVDASLRAEHDVASSATHTTSGDRKRRTANNFVEEKRKKGVYNEDDEDDEDDDEEEEEEDFLQPSDDDDDDVDVNKSGTSTPVVSPRTHLATGHGGVDEKQRATWARKLRVIDEIVSEKTQEFLSGNGNNSVSADDASLTEKIAKNLLKKYAGEIFAVRSMSTTTDTNEEKNNLTKKIIEFEHFRAVDGELLCDDEFSRRFRVRAPDQVATQFANWCERTNRQKLLESTPASVIEQMAEAACGQSDVERRPVEPHKLLRKMRDIAEFDRDFGNTNNGTTTTSSSSTTTTTLPKNKGDEDDEAFSIDGPEPVGAKKKKTAKKSVVNSNATGDNATEEISLQKQLTEIGVDVDFERFVARDSVWQRVINWSKTSTNSTSTASVMVLDPVVLTADDVAPFLFQAYGRRRACSAGEACRGLVDFRRQTNGGVVLMEFLGPRDDMIFRRGGPLPPHRSTCILCTRFIVQQTVARSRRSGHRCSTAAFPHSYVVDRPGGYARDSLLGNQPDATDGNCWPQRRYNPTEYVRCERVVQPTRGEMRQNFDYDRVVDVLSNTNVSNDDDDNAYDEDAPEPIKLQGFSEVGCFFA